MDTTCVIPIPKEIFVIIFSKLSPKTIILGVNRVCKPWREIASTLWETYCKKICNFEPEYSSSLFWFDYFKYLTDTRWEEQNSVQVGFDIDKRTVTKKDNFPDISLVFSNRRIVGKNLCTFSIHSMSDEMLIGITDSIPLLKLSSAHGLTLHKNTWAYFDGSRYSGVQLAGTLHKGPKGYREGDKVGIYVDREEGLLVFYLNGICQHSSRVLPSDKELTYFVMLDAKQDKVHIKDETYKLIWN